MMTFYKLFICLAFVLPLGSAQSNAMSRLDLVAYGQSHIDSITKQAIMQAAEISVDVVEDLHVIDSKNTVVLDYLSNFEAFVQRAQPEIANGNYTQATLNAFYDIIDVFLHVTANEPLSNGIEQMLVFISLQRCGFDRWKRTMQVQTNNLVRRFGNKLKGYMATLPPENERLEGIRARWNYVLQRGKPHKLDKLREFVNWLNEMVN